MVRVLDIPYFTLSQNTYIPSYWVCFIENDAVCQLTRYSSADISFLSLTSLATIEPKDCDVVQSVFCSRPGSSVVVGSIVGSVRWRLGSTVSFRIGTEEIDLFREGAELMHITARKKSVALFIRLLLKSSVRPDPWTPDLRTSGKSTNSPHASVATLAPVAVKSNPKRQS